MNRFSRSSRATGPKMRVPRGFCWSLMRHDGVVVEADVGAVRAPALLRRAHDDRLHDLALLHRAAGQGVLHRRRRTRRRCRRSGARSRRARGCTGPPWPPCCPRPCSASPVGSRLLRPLHDLDDPPALRLRQRPGLDDADACRPRARRSPRRAPRASWTGAPSCRTAGAGPAGRSARRRSCPCRRTRRRRCAPCGGRDRFVVAPSSSSASLTRRPPQPSCFARSRRLDPSSSSSRSRSTVVRRATSWRSSLSRAVLSSCPVASWNRRLNSSSFALSMRDVAARRRAARGARRPCSASSLPHPA